MGETVKYALDENRLPEAWVNIASDLPEPPAIAGLPAVPV
jgi:predicted alternative tryptophan synthase beta-subunit